MRQIKSVEIFRLICCICVIAGHSVPFAGSAPDSKFYYYLSVGISQLIRFVVPFFCIISGYFWGVRVRDGKDPISSANQMAKKIGFIYLAWCIIYLLPYNITAVYRHGIFGPVKIAYQNALVILNDPPLQTIMQGTKPQLWFLVALLFSVYITAIFVKNRLPVALIVLSICLYVFGVLAKAYELTPIGLEAHFNTRDGPFFGTVGFATGYFMSKLKPSSKWLYYGLPIYFFGLSLHLFEVYFLLKYYGLGPIHDYVFGTYFMGLGIAVLSLSNHPRLQNDFLSQFGPLTLGIYVSHFIFVDLLRFIDNRTDHPVWELGYIVIVLILSIALTKFLSKLRWAKKIVV